MKDINSTIVALSTPVGYGAIGIIRISGPAATHIVRPFIHNNIHLIPNQVQFTKICDNQEHIDDVLITYFKSPKSYTGEDIIEISCHGSPYIIETIIDLCLANGAILAEPGEFTRRAFLNDKMDLSQAEGVDSLIHAKTKHAHQTAKNLLEGQLGKTITKFKKDLIDTITLLELELDFSDQEIEFTPHEKIRHKITDLKNNISELMATYYYGKIIKEGVKTVLIGPPNSGKSSLMNALLQEERSIVSEIPGTTRDYIEESFRRDGYQFRLIDTAGLRSTKDKIEILGIERAYEAINSADLKIILIDSFAFKTDLLSEVQKLADKQTIIAINKIDIATPEQVKKLTSLLAEYSIIKISAKEHTNIHQLTDKMVSKIKQLIPRNSDLFITIKRHFNILKETIEELDKTLNSIDKGNPSELIVTDMRFALDHLDKILGKTTDDDILNNIFQNFCIGK